MPLELRRITDPTDPAIASFGRLQDATYFEPDMLIPASFIGQMLEWSDSSRSNHLIVLKDAGRVVAGTLFHYLAKPKIGFSSYLAVAPAYRGRGLARQLHDARAALLEEISNGVCSGVLIDVVNPARLTAAELELERSVGSDPANRLQVFSSLGFKRVDVRYEQPVGGADGGPVTNMDLLLCPRELASSVPTALIVAAMLEFWTPWLGRKTAQAAAKALETRADGDELALIALV